MKKPFGLDFNRMIEFLLDSQPSALLSKRSENLEFNRAYWLSQFQEQCKCQLCDIVNTSLDDIEFTFGKGYISVYVKSTNDDLVFVQI